MGSKARVYFGGILTATLLVAALPAAADQRVHFIDRDFTLEEDTANLGYFQCSGPVYHGIVGHEDLWLWFPAGSAIWNRGQYVLQGIDYFSTKRGMEGNVVLGKGKITTHLSGHEVNSQGESWDEVLTGLNWNIHAPGVGTIFNQTFGVHRSTEFTPPDQLFYQVIKEAVGHDLFDFEELCESLGYTLVWSVSQ